MHSSPGHTDAKEFRRRLLAIAIALLALGYAGLWMGQRFAAIWAVGQPTSLHVAAFLPQNGGWVSDPLRVTSGQNVSLHITGIEGVHALAIGHTAIAGSPVLPGQEVTLDFVAPQPGRYVLYCTVLCSPDHWRMRTVLEVTSILAPDLALSYRQESPRFAGVSQGLNLDVPHPAAVWPTQRPSAMAGELLWHSLDLTQSPAQLLVDGDWPQSSPAQIAQRLAEGQPTWTQPAVALSAAERWSLVAYLWREASSPQAQQSGEKIYVQSCAACHGLEGRGDGPVAATSPGVEPDLQAAQTMAGASPALYYAKIARGGMGTGMPNWGLLLTEDELWAVTDYLFSFLFDYKP